MSASNAKGSEAFQACLLAISVNKSKICPSRGKAALLYRGSTKAGDIWKVIELRQRKHEQNYGYSAPYEMLSQGLKRAGIKVTVDGRAVPLDVALNNAKLFQPGEIDDIWDALSSIWTANADRVITWIGSSDKPEETIFEAVELPVLKMRGGCDPAIAGVVKKAVQALERKLPADKELAEVEKCFKADFKEILRALEKRKTALKAISSEDQLDDLYKWMSKLSKLSH